MRSTFLPLFFSFALAIFISSDVYSDTPSGLELEIERAKKPMAWDLGPEMVDISQYPPEIQADYKVFATKCGKCHTLARPLNSPYCTAEEWNNYVNKMMRKPGSGITPVEGKQIFDFLVYDSKVRKLSNPDAWNKHIDQILAAFQEKYGHAREKASQ
ncbi:MAG TPA: hypothetical protein ACFYD3_10855 [Candidatus Hypogeohydataceae bacterium YC41]